MNAIVASVACILAVASAGGAEEEKWSVAALAGNYEGRDVIDTEEWITLRGDGTFTYDFIPFDRPGGASYRGRWKIDEAIVVLLAPLEDGGEEEFRLLVTREKGAIALTYTLVQRQKQKAALLIPNVFVRTEKKAPNQLAEATPLARTETREPRRQSYARRGAPHE